MTWSGRPLAGQGPDAGSRGQQRRRDARRRYCHLRRVFLPTRPSKTGLLDPVGELPRVKNELASTLRVSKMRVLSLGNTTIKAVRRGSAGRAGVLPGRRERRLGDSGSGSIGVQGSSSLASLRGGGGGANAKPRPTRAHVRTPVPLPPLQPGVQGGRTAPIGLRPWNKFYYTARTDGRRETLCEDGTPQETRRLASDARLICRPEQKRPTRKAQR